MIWTQKYWIAILTIVAFTLGTAVVALSEGDTFPVPPEGWWKSLKGGETCIYKTVTNSNVLGSWEMETVMTIEKVNGSNITYNTQTSKGKTVFPKETQTVNAVDSLARNKSLPPGTILKKLEDTIYEAGGLRFNCTIYEFEVQGMKRKYWYSPQLPYTFYGGCVKIVEEAAGMITEVTLKSYNGSLL